MIIEKYLRGFNYYFNSKNAPASAWEGGGGAWPQTHYQVPVDGKINFVPPQLF